MEYTLADATSLFIPPKTELNELLQPVFQHMQENYPDRVLLVKMHQAEMFKIDDDIRLVNEKLMKDFLTGEMLGLASQMAQGITNLSEKNVD